MIKLIQRGSYYHARFSFRLKQYKISLKTRNQRAANLIVSQIERGVDQGIFDSFERGTQGYQILTHLIAQPGLRAAEAREQMQSNGNRKRFMDAVNEYLESCETEHSAKNYRNEKRVFEEFSKFINVAYVSEVTPESVESWRNKRTSAVSKSTVNRELKMVKRFFKQLHENGHLHKNPTVNLRTYRTPDTPIRHLSDDEVKRIIAVAPPDLNRIIVFLLLTGLRYGELCHLRWADVDFRRNQIVIHPQESWNTKNLRKRVIPMHPDIPRLLQDVKHKSDYVFPDSAGKCAELGLRNRLYRIFGKAGVNCNVKDLRSTFASNAVMSGIPIYTVSKLLGHQDVKITEKYYAHLAPDYMANTIKTLKSSWNELATIQT